MFQSIREVSEPTQTRRFLSWLLRGIVGINLFRIALGWSTWFEGSAEHAGTADRLFPNRGGGFRGDFLWLMSTTLVILFAFIYLLVEIRRSRSARIDALLCAIEVIGFVLYVFHALLSGVLYFG